MPINIPELDKERIVIVGAGFAGLTLAAKLDRKRYQVVLLDRNNFHQFQPLFYQVAMSGLEPSSISFPLRKLFRRKKGLHIRMTEVHGIDPDKKRIRTATGIVNYDHLLLANGARTNYFNNENLEKETLSLKSTAEALYLRNRILTDFERALSIRDEEERRKILTIVIVGAGPTGVEMAGSLAEMKHFILPGDYPELDTAEVTIYLVEGTDRVLPTMSESASGKAEEYLLRMGIRIRKGLFVTDFRDGVVHLSNEEAIVAGKVIWAAGIKPNVLPGIPGEAVSGDGRILVDRVHKVNGLDAVYAVGDLCRMETPAYPEGHPQLAQTALQQAANLAGNFNRISKGKEPRPYAYRDKGTMATVGRSKAVVDLPKFSFSGFFAWIVWLVVHLFALIGARNKIIVLFNWLWSYINYDQSLRIIVRPVNRKQ